MATFMKFYCFPYDLGLEKHNLDADEITLYLSNATPDSNNDDIKSDLAEITAANGYNNVALDCNWTIADNIASLKSNNDQTWTANGAFGPFRYVVLCNANSDANFANAALIGCWDYASSINCNNGESFTVDFPANKVILSIS